MNRRNLLVLSALLLMFALAACAGDEEIVPTVAPLEPTPEVEVEVGEEDAATTEPTEEPTEEPEVEALTPAVTVEDQELADGTVTVPSVTAAEPGWIVIHADEDGAPGPVIGHTAVEAGENQGVVVEVDEAGATETLYAMLHVDAGTTGEYEFPGDDGPVTVDGNVVVQPFNLTGGMAAITPALTVEDQELADGTVTVPSVTAAEPGWIVIHADEDGAPGPVIGHTAVETGENQDVVVEVDEAGATETLYAMLHVDAGTAGEYEFPGDDGPVTVEGNVVVQPFALTGGMADQGVTGELSVGLELVADGLNAPVVFKPFPDGSGRHAIVDQIGLIYVLDEEGNLLDEPFLDLRAQLVELMTDFDERGLLGLAFHPDYAENGRFFVYYSAPLRESAPADWNHTSHISEFQVSADNPNVADPDSEQLLLQVDQPQFNHDAGQITFGPDGYLYIPLGDGGGANDVGLGHVSDWYEFNEGGNGQDLDDNLLGSILRIDIDAEGTDGQPYGIPEDNPFVDTEGIAPEIWAYGLRNPFRISFDMGGDNALYVGDAGQDRWEEVSIVEAGGNYGWNVKEGTHCFDAANPGQPLDECPDTDPEGDPLIDPIIEYQNANQEGGLGLVVIGGYVYRGDALSNLEGAYVFGDWSDSFAEGNGKLFVAAPGAGEGLWQIQDLAVSNTEDGNLNTFLLSFGQDAAGELYILTSDTTGPTGETGRVYRLVPPEMADEAMARGETEEEQEMTEETDEEAAGEQMVTIEDFAFTPEELTVPVGTTVVWTNRDSVAHTVTAGSPDSPNPDLFDSGNLNQGDTFSFTFDEPGSFAYFCTIHPSMTATIIVEE